MSAISRAIFAGVLIIGMTACATPSMQMSDVTWHPESNVGVLMQNVVINTRRHPDRSLAVVIVEGDAVRQRRQIEWSVSWFDHSGRKIEGLSDRYRRTTLIPGVPFQLEAASPVDNAGRARIHIRESN